MSAEVNPVNESVCGETIVGEARSGDRGGSARNVD